MSGWILWVIAACVFGVAKVLTRRVLFAWLALAAVVSAIADVLGAPALPLWLEFVLVSVLGAVLVRARREAQAKGPPQMRAGGANLIGKQAIVLETIANDEGVGCIGVDGEIWTARALEHGQVIEQGSHVEIVDVRGAAALVVR